MEHVTLRVIGTVLNGRADVHDDFDWGAVESTIRMRPEFAAALLGLEAFSHAVVVFFMHRGTGETATLRRRPRGRDDLPLVGVFAQRGRNRPNPIGVTAVTLVRVEPGGVVVRGLDAVDGTPVLDLKPYYPEFDRRDATVPDWVSRLMQGYFER